jgi:ribulose-phosphate 3-epimerase
LDLGFDLTFGFWILMPEIVPAIIAKNFQELEQKLKMVEPHAKAAQLDVMDGVFVGNETWNNPEDLEGLKTELLLEAHLMVERPQEIIGRWIKSRAKRIILHWEALEKIHGHEMTPHKTSAGPGFPVIDLAEEAHKRNKELGVALNPNTPISVLDSFISDIDSVLLMSVDPGKAGQEFLGQVTAKIKSLRQKYPEIKIGVDGGINLNNAGEIARAGADILVAGSAIFESGDVGKAIEELKKIASS